MRILRIFDVLPFLYAGSVNKWSYLLSDTREEEDAYAEYRIQTGGISLLWNVLYDEYGKCDLAFCLDSRPTIKQKMFPDYKGNREHKEHISVMKDVCEYILEDCGLSVLSADGYEADDFIHSLVQEHWKRYDHIYIYTGDSDLYYLVKDNVTILPSSSRAKMVDIQNYTYTARRDKYTPYNASTFLKILYGDTSDNIPPLPRNLIDRLMDGLYNDMYYKYLGDKESALSLLSMYGEEARSRGELIFPLDVRVPLDFQQGDKVRIAEWGSALRNKLWRTADPIPRHIQDKIEEMVDLGWYTDTE